MQDLKDKKKGKIIYVKKTIKILEKEWMLWKKK